MIYSLTAFDPDTIPSARRKTDNPTSATGHSRAALPCLSALTFPQPCRNAIIAPLPPNRLEERLIE